MRLMKWAVLVMALPAFFAGANAGVADTVFINGRIYTMNDTQLWAEAIAVRGDKIFGSVLTAALMPGSIAKPILSI